MLKIYGHPGSRAARTLWVCRELGVQFEHIPTHFADGGTKSAAFLAINPAGRIPAIDDDGFCLAESMAINIYLAKKHGGELAPRSLEDEARMLQWSFWAMTEAEKPLVTLFMQRFEVQPGSELEKYFRERSPKDPATEQAALKALEHPLTVLNDHLANREYLLGSSFTLADLNVASVMSMGLAARFDFSPYPGVQQWLGRCLGRPAARPPKKS
jgi:glutathione S-transferase